MAICTYSFLHPQPLQQPHDIFFMFRSNKNQTLLAWEIQKYKIINLVILEGIYGQIFLQDVGPQDFSTYYNEVCIAKVTKVIK